MPYQNRKPELGKDELEGFENYVRSKYLHDFEQARDIVNLFLAKTWGENYKASNESILAVFDKLATPRVFLIEEWRRLSDEDRLSFYSKDYQDKAKAEAEAGRLAR